ncbi:hypothetical protein [Sphingobacterium gobiense]|uniref:DUF4844 domain-containing protein n=1 Tax=Sphingobacterium gobiense TaxID=1382456 RepID=A0A2S9JNN7_9SPHI|nr:hypothetical protein [Sphingobacterium gobiense]PRD54741.1 hypothetical protein C5749_15015 [Sphingobacterium gobiense]
MAMENYKNELDRIRAIIENFYVAKFACKEEEYEANKNNKEQIGKFIFRIKQANDLLEPEQQDLMNGALELLARNTGDAEDGEIAEQIIDNLFYDLKIIDQNDIDRFYQYNATGRWE